MFLSWWLQSKLCLRLSCGNGGCALMILNTGIALGEGHVANSRNAQPVDHGTSNITVTDETGLTVTLTTTIGQIWASRIIVPGYNIVLNDSLDDFSIPGRPNGFGYAPSPANYVQAGKRPQSSSCPYILERASPDSLSPEVPAGPDLMAGGAAGGSTIISCNVQVIRNMVDYGMPPGEALSFRRLHNQLLPNVTTFEQDTDRGAPVQGWKKEDAMALEKRGHKVEWIPSEYHVRPLHSHPLLSSLPVSVTV